MKYQSNTSEHQKCTAVRDAMANAIFIHMCSTQEILLHDTQHTHTHTHTHPGEPKRFKAPLLRIMMEGAPPILAADTSLRTGGCTTAVCVDQIAKLPTPSIQASTNQHSPSLVVLAML